MREAATTPLRLFLLAAWTVLLCVVPDPRPLGAPDWVVSAVRLTGLAEPVARMIATAGLRAGGVALLGALLMFAVGATRWSRRSILAVLLAPGLAIFTMWVNVGYFPIGSQLALVSVSAVLGAIAFLAMLRNKVAAFAFTVVILGFVVWGASIGISDDETRAARATGRHLLDVASEIPSGDAGFERALEIAFAFAADSSHASDPIQANRAAVLALAVVLGDEHIATLAGRYIDTARLAESEALRARILVGDRPDWPRHFFASAGLAVLSGSRTNSLGIAKELMDATTGGSGFSFTDLAADAAGKRFAHAATRDINSARAMQSRLRSGAHLADFLPDMHDLPEGLSADDFHKRYGGLGGEGTLAVVAEIERRLAACTGLR